MIATTDGAAALPDTIADELRMDAAAAWHQGRAEGYAEGHADGLAARPPRDVWIPIPLRWRHITAGDVIVAADHGLWRVAASAPHRGRWRLTMTSPTGVHGDYDGDPDEPADVLTPIPEVDALRLTRDVLGARILERRTGAA